MTEKRTGDTVKISGNYQYKAITQGNPIQRFWHFSKKRAIKKYLPPSPSDYILDVGCGSGVITSYLGEFGATVLGIDGNKVAINFAKSQFENNSVKFKEGLVDENMKTNQPVDKIYNMEVIEHIYLDQGKSMLKSFYRLLKPEGKVSLTTPNYKSFWPLIEWLMDLLKLAPNMKEDQHVELYHKKKLTKLCSEIGFKIITKKTNCFLAPWISPLSWKLAEKLDSLESSLPFGGSILIFVLEKAEQIASRDADSSGR